MEGENTWMTVLKPDGFRTISGRFPDDFRTISGQGQEAFPETEYG
jgi:hypothetical protein